MQIAKAYFRTSIKMFFIYLMGFSFYYQLKKLKVESLICFVTLKPKSYIKFNDKFRRISSKAITLFI